jgi:glutathione S-transferase
MPDPSTVRVVECSPPSWIVRLALEEKGLDHECKLLSYTASEHKSPEMLAKNPRGTVPVLMDGNIVVYETLAILDYLEYAYPQPALLPNTHALRALALTRLHEANNLKQVGMQLFSYLMSTKAIDLDPGEVDHLCSFLHDELFFWEYYYGVARWAAGSEISLADLAVFAYVATAAHLGLELEERYPNLHAFCSRMKQRPSAVATWPAVWKPTPYSFLTAEPET